MFTGSLILDSPSVHIVRRGCDTIVSLFCVLRFVTLGICTANGEKTFPRKVGDGPLLLAHVDTHGTGQCKIQQRCRSDDGPKELLISANFGATHAHYRVAHLCTFICMYACTSAMCIPRTDTTTPAFYRT